MKKTLPSAIKKATAINAEYLKYLKSCDTSEIKNAAVKKLVIDQESLLSSLNIKLKKLSANPVDTDYSYSALMNYRQYMDTFITVTKEQTSSTGPLINIDIFQLIESIEAHIIIFKHLDPQCQNHTIMLDVLAYYLKMTEKANTLFPSDGSPQAPTSALLPQAEQRDQEQKASTKIPEQSGEMTRNQGKTGKSSEEPEQEYVTSQYIDQLLVTKDIAGISSVVEHLADRTINLEESQSVYHIELIYHLISSTVMPGDMRELIFDVLKILIINKDDGPIQEILIDTLETVKKKYPKVSKVKKSAQTYKETNRVAIRLLLNIIKKAKLSQQSPEKKAILSKILQSWCKKVPSYKHNECIHTLKLIGGCDSNAEIKFIQDLHEKESTLTKTTSTALTEKSKEFVQKVSFRPIEELYVELTDGNFQAIINEQGHNVPQVISRIDSLIKTMLTQPSLFAQIYKSHQGETANNLCTQSEQMHQLTVSVLKKVQQAHNAEAMFVYGRLLEMLTPITKNIFAIVGKKSSSLVDFLAKHKQEKNLYKLDQSVAEALYGEEEAKSLLTLTDFLFQSYASSILTNAISTLKDLYHCATEIEKLYPCLEGTQTTKSNKKVSSIKKKASKIQSELIKPEFVGLGLNSAVQKKQTELSNLGHEIIEHIDQSGQLAKAIHKRKTQAKKQIADKQIKLAWLRMSEAASRFYQCILKRVHIQKRAKKPLTLQSTDCTPEQKDDLVKVYCEISQNKETLEEQKGEVIEALTLEEKNQTFVSFDQNLLPIGSLFRPHQDQENYLAVVDYKPKGEKVWTIAKDTIYENEVQKEMLRVIDDREVYAFTKVP